ARVHCRLQSVEAWAPGQCAENLSSSAQPHAREYSCLKTRQARRAGPVSPARLAVPKSPARLRRVWWIPSMRPRSPAPPAAAASRTRDCCERQRHPRASWQKPDQCRPFIEFLDDARELCFTRLGLISIGGSCTENLRGVRFLCSRGLVTRESLKQRPIAHPVLL